MNVKCGDMLEPILMFLIPSRSSEAHRVKVGSYFWTSRRRRSLSLRACSRATLASQSCDSRVCSWNGRISRSCFNNNWEDMIFKETADVIPASDQDQDTRALRIISHFKTGQWLFNITKSRIQIALIYWTKYSNNLICTVCCLTGFLHRTWRRFTWFPTSGCCRWELFVLNTSPAGTPAGVSHSVPSAAKTMKTTFTLLCHWQWSFWKHSSIFTKLTAHKTYFWF